MRLAAAAPARAKTVRRRLLRVDRAVVAEFRARLNRVARVLRAKEMRGVLTGRAGRSSVAAVAAELGRWVNVDPVIKAAMAEWVRSTVSLAPQRTTVVVAALPTSFRGEPTGLVDSVVVAEWV